MDPIYEIAVQLAKSVDADAVLLLMESSVDLDRLKKLVGRRRKLIIAGDTTEDLAGAEETELETVLLNMPEERKFT